jgi:polyferredoxin
MNYKKLIMTLLFGFVAIYLCNATVSKHVADSIQEALNQNHVVCDQSNLLYETEHQTTRLMNTLFISLLLVFGSGWLFISYKKKFILVLGAILTTGIIGIYFWQPFHLINPKQFSTLPLTEQSVSKCSGCSEKSSCSEFKSENGGATPDSSKTDIVSEFSAASNDEFTASTSEFSSTENSEYQPKVSSQSDTDKSIEENKPINYHQIYEALIIFLILGIIALLIKYPTFRKTRGLFLLAGLLYLGFYRGGCPCMISSFQNTVLYIFGAKVHWESMLWFLILLPATYLFGKVWCGWLCHLGALQEFLFRSFKLKILTTIKAQKILKIVLIAVFIIWIVQLLITKTNLYCEYDPFKVAFNLVSVNTTGYILLALLLISSVLINRPFCRTICPVGLVLGWVSLLPGARRLKKHDTCINCKSCHNECNKQAMIHENRKTELRHDDCIMCGECFSSCNKDALKVDFTRMKKNKKITMILLVFMFITSASAQWECPSRLGGSLKPIDSSNLMWASELTTTGGMVGNYGIANLMGFVGFDYTVNKHTFYIEGGVKSWARFSSDSLLYRENTAGTLTLTDNAYFNSLVKFGMREVFYKYAGEKQTLTAGLQSAKSEDYYLLNERMVGLNYRLNLGNFTINAIGGSVLKQSSRNGTFCTLGYLYNIVPGRPRAILGNALGETNLAMMTIGYKPSDKVSNNEFATENEFGDSPKSSWFKVTNLGGVVYREFGSWNVYNPLITGLFAEVDLLGINLKSELLNQSSVGNNAWIYSLGADKQITWSNGHLTRLYGRYIGTYAIDSGAVAANSFSNVFAGEVLRLDALELPILQIGFKHSIPAWKASAKIQYAMQTGLVSGYLSDPYGNSVNPGKMKELDFTLSKSLGKYLSINATAGYLTYPKMTSVVAYQTANSLWGKVEMRITF